MRKFVITALAAASAILLPAGMAGAQDQGMAAGGGSDYPPCSRGVTDKCTQTHEGMGGGMMAGEHHGMMKHHGRHHMMKHHGRHHMMKHHGKHHAMKHHMKHKAKAK